MAEGGSPPRESPPKAVVDTSPLLNSLEQNKESLKVKLMMRRPVEQLVDQGIMPPLKTPAAFHGQRRQLERAKTGDLLKSKIQQRPSRTELESRHILEPDPHVDPSLADKQRKLKKARLADQLNDQLSHRPGPLELIRKNILHTEEHIENAVKAGHIPYRATCEGQLNRPQHPLSYVNPEDDSQSSEDNSASPGPSETSEPVVVPKPTGIVVSLIPTSSDTVVLARAAIPPAAAATVIKTETSDIAFADLCRSVAAPLLSQASASSPASLVSSTSTLSPLSSIASPGPSILSQPATPGPPVQVIPRALATTPTVPVVRSDAPGKVKNGKKCKSKSTPKARTIKFHEYKGPPSAQKSSSSNSSYNPAQDESPYELLLQQQQLLLQYQLQNQNKNNKHCLILPAAQKTVNDTQQANNAVGNAIQLSSTSTSVGGGGKSAPTTDRLLGRLEDMKVMDLKAELKRRSLPVSGSKPQLIERLKPFTNGSAATQASSPVNAASPAATAVVIAAAAVSTSCDSVQEIESAHNSPLHHIEMASPQTIISEDQSEMMDVSECEPLSPMSLSQQPIDVPGVESQEVINSQMRRIEELERELTLSRLQLQAATQTEHKSPYLQLLQQIQVLQQTTQQQQQQQNAEEQQKQHVAFQNQKNLAANVVINGNDGTLVLNPFDKHKLTNGHNRSNSLPDFVNSLIHQTVLVKPDVEMKTPLPVYEEIKCKKTPMKSQDMEDILEILIKNGELPESAAQIPITPSSANSVKMAEAPVFPAAYVHNLHVHSPPPTSQQQLVVQHAQLPPHVHEDSALAGLDTNDILRNFDLDADEFSTILDQCMQNHNVNGIMQTAGDNGNMEVSMEMDDWLETCLKPTTASDNFANANNMLTTSNNNVPDITPSQELGYDPLLAIGQNPLDPFNLDEFRTSADLTASWDRLDFAA